ncbi:MAG: Uma2 family endonuclease [Pseudanabaena sp. M135S2SP2A07QC]|jgi:Uma2 family endonuclease|nr:Uma2 family endonuclease [Pseudanabaena sp. M090S1SP2A07QC]MCA6505833.1 Uma2 family endonuclease [Pseudanabaena sp. M172S2SP2A07QC]MCA6521549.1 Uma2 family endonuclease [Pseudanabaena sp. M051S1SP2A07QC]MCA6525310.1 Uma2 family endonuclease [Pseudanabaena sp. M179S2SP2A07QC]MCA6528427.1 Uma2 family endonuclease [Pseudanabaena sp. M125S2SP2A07QC]MCA6533710.1 Uma2 family endonuclease [Pseudanabaena sp. M176S2SP2A07QC]MCA6539403.1 Uma2 family endonuclease [Pseudanabaena sp. M037S2SP2A07QC]MC
MVVTPVVDRLEAVSHESSPDVAQNDQSFITLETYRAISETAEERLEYRNGEIFTMSGGTANHSAIAVNLIIYLGFLLRDTDFRMYNGDMRIWIPEFQCGTYADVLVINGEPEFNGICTDEILNPLLIVEVLSPSTEGYDRGEKFRKYRSIPSLREYILISQSEAYIEHYSKSASKSENIDIWQFQISDRLDQKITLPSLNIEVSLSEIYRRIIGIS